MIVLFITLWSLCAIYFTRLLMKRTMRAAAISVTVLYVYVVAWIYAIFILDIADLGFADVETRLSLLHGSNVYHAFVQMTAKMSIIPLPLLKAIVSVVALVISASIIVALHGMFEITFEIHKFFKNNKLAQTHKNELTKNRSVNFTRAISIIRLHCRANC